MKKKVIQKNNNILTRDVTKVNKSHEQIDSVVDDSFVISSLPTA